MSRRRTKKTTPVARSRKTAPDPVEAQIDRLVATSRPPPVDIQAEVHAALDRLGAIFRVDKSISDALRDELGVRLLTAQSPDVFVYGAKRRPERLILLNFIETGGKCRVDPSAVHEECSHAIRSVFHPIENPMIQEFFGALGPILALDKRLISGGPMLEMADTLFRMRQGGGHFTEIPDSLAERLKKFLPPDILATAEAGGDNNEVARGFLENSINHMMPMLAGESMADTGHLKDLMDRYQLILLPPKEIAMLLTDYGRRCAQDESWKDKHKGFRKVCGYYLRPETP